ncbi:MULTISPECIES: thioredoxin-disulfide reductase [unclassified Siphonobacter]|uniref:thioredoxin-disulfide reductase n=1 Tax=unclassified Siphonobacter TaxID=2635712 RepID=UPI000CC9F18E|nr:MULTISPECIES: thioredoxin-disulfide reductase [unclassified Siphonobacter]MDQ1089090.1 thioredoxin reductase (NADPH) [Siphonobacter sp. SORGH_AS_1065]MDR6195266.1 thioredoxin reductase (NADPH) [Siphonobacter sp. SORGH_AS_0500]PKK38278.1 thioredoxin-disulfide reductase [Siphonobacter sp. SORGH_AS_0500]
MSAEHIHCLIIGSGPAGYTAAIYASRAGLNPVLYTGPQPGGQLTTTTEVDNFPGYPEGVTGPEMMQDLEKQARRFGTEIRYGLATKVDFSDPTSKKVWIDETHEICADAIIISTGASAKWLGLAGEDIYNGRGVSACAVCDGFFYRGQEVVVVGGGDTAAEEASYLAKLCKKVYLLVRRDELRASQIMQTRVKSLPNLEILWNTETEELLGDETGLTGARVKNVITGETQDLCVTGFFVAIGHKPNTDIFKDYITMDTTGYIKTVPGSSRTNVAGVFACGDAQDNVYRQAITAAGTGCMAALDAERWLAEMEAPVVITPEILEN